MDPYDTGGMGGMSVMRNAMPNDKSDRVEYGFTAGKTLWVPGGWNAQKPELSFYEGTIWYRQYFDIEKVQQGKRYFIYVGAANYIATVSCNGKRLGKHEGGFTPFCYEITNCIRDNGNFVIIGVNNSRGADYIPSKVADWFNHGGITREVKVVEVPATFINNYFIALDKATLHDKTKKIDVALEISGAKRPDKARIVIPELKINQEVAVNATGAIKFTVSAKNLQLWSPENPKLYTVTIEAGDDRISDEIGFRTIETKGKQILLNGNPVFLKGICLHDENPLRGDRANSVDDAKLVLGWAKE